MRYKILAIIILVSFILISFASAQDKEQKEFSQNSEKWWLSAGIGGSHFGPCFSGGFTYNYNNSLFTVRYFQADEFNFNVEGQYDQPSLTCKEFGFLYGMSYVKNHGSLSLSAGISYVSGTDRGNLIAYHQFESINISTLGIPFEAKFRINIIGSIGVGGSWFGNINSTKSYTGGMFEISAGVL